MNRTIEHNWYKIAGMVILLVPVGMLLLFTVGEVFGGDIGGLQHLLEAGVLALVAVIAWRRPALSGSVLVAVGTLLAALYFYDQYRDARAATLILTELFFFVPPIVTGILFLLAAREDRERASG